MFVKKFCNWLSHFLRICILQIFIYVRNDPNNFLFFLAYEFSKYAQFYTDFKSVEIIGKSPPEKVLCQTLLQVSSIEEEILIFFTLFLANFHIFLNSFKISVKFCVVLIPIFKFCKKNVFMSY